jgi:hypothetical protein
VSMNLDYHDMWHDLYDSMKINPDPYAQYVAAIMEEMDPRLVEDEETTKKWSGSLEDF